MGWTFFDNFQVRTLGGSSFFNLPPGFIKVVHLDKVISLLSQFDYILFTEDFESKINQQVFEKCMVFTQTDLHSNPYKKGLGFTPQEEELIRSQSEYDFASLKHFQQSFDCAWTCH